MTEQEIQAAIEKVVGGYRVNLEREIRKFLKADVSYMQNRHVLEGWLFANFIARKSLLQIIRPPAESGTSEKRRQ